MPGTPTTWTSLSIFHYIETGKIRALGLSSKSRSNIEPGIAALDAGVPGYDATSWFGVFTTAGTPPVIQKLNTALVASIKTPEIAGHLRKLGAEPVGSSSQDLDRFLRAEVEKWRDVVKTANVQLN